MSDFLLLGLLLLAVVIGYCGGRAQNRRSLRVSDLPHESAQEMTLGLNYLLNEQTDAAIETFVQALQSHTESIEPAIALAKLYCRRGELDNAVLICQQQLARPSLSKEENAQVLQALGEAYLQSGLLDRAESLFLEVVQNGGTKADTARLKLLRVYEKEQAWGEAIKIGKPLARKNLNVALRLAHYSLAIAERHFSVKESRLARSFLSQALKYDKGSIRALILQIHLDAYEGGLRDVMKNIERLLGFKNTAHFISGPLSDVIRGLFLDEKDYIEWLKKVSEHYPSVTLIMHLLILISEEDGAKVALDYLMSKSWLDGYLGKKRIQLLVAYFLIVSNPSCYGYTGRWMERSLGAALETSYRCAHCGRKDTHFSWLCRHCGEWGGLKSDNEDIFA